MQTANNIVFGHCAALQYHHFKHNVFASQRSSDVITHSYAKYVVVSKVSTREKKLSPKGNSFIAYMAFSRKGLGYGAVRGEKWKKRTRSSSCGKGVQRRSKARPHR